jgi:hypothetical protein
MADLTKPHCQDPWRWSCLDDVCLAEGVVFGVCVCGLCCGSPSEMYGLRTCVVG